MDITGNPYIDDDIYKMVHIAYMKSISKELIERAFIFRIRRTIRDAMERIADFAPLTYHEFFGDVIAPLFRD